MSFGSQVAATSKAQEVVWTSYIVRVKLPETRILALFPVNGRPTKQHHPN